MAGAGDSFFTFFPIFLCLRWGYFIFFAGILKLHTQEAFIYKHPLWGICSTGYMCISAE
jgi:hypothetical protein